MVEFFKSDYFSLSCGFFSEGTLGLYNVSDTKLKLIVVDCAKQTIYQLFESYKTQSLTMANDK